MSRRGGLLAWPALALGLALAAPPAAAADVPVPRAGDMRVTTVASGLTAPTAVRFAADGTMFVAEQRGRVLRFGGPGDPPAGRLVVDLQDEVNSMWDRGLLGLALDPGFVVNRRLYLLYTYDAPPGETAPRWNDDCPADVGATDAGCVVSGRLVRVTLDALGSAASIDTLVTDEWCAQFPSHSVGTVAFGPDGALYAGAGDGAYWQTDWGQFGGQGGVPANPCGDPPAGAGHANEWPDAQGGSLRAQDVRTPGDPTGLDGAIARVSPETGAPLPGSPFAAGDLGARRIVAYGLRNPFRFAFRPGTRELWIGDVGQGATEELDRIPDAADGVAENFGWPCLEGRERARAWDTFTMCTSLPDAAVTAPYFSYPHNANAAPGDGCPADNGASISGLAFRSGGDWPAAYAGALFISDYARNCIWWMRAGADGVPDPATLAPFASAPVAGSGPVELQAGPGGDLYAVLLDGVHPEQGSVVRYSYAATGPVAAVTASGEDGGLAFDLDASGSTDRDGQPLSFAWDLDGDGAFDDGTGATLHHTYAAPRRVTVRVRVTDADGLWDTAAAVLYPGDRAPVPVIESPADGTRFSVGEAIEFAGSAADREDGALGPGALSWTLTMMHCPAGACHAHAITAWPGVAGGSFAAPDHDVPSHLVLRLTATDALGQARSAERRLDPRLATVRVETDPPGLPVRLLGGGEQPSPQAVTVFDGAAVSVGVPASAELAGERWELTGWSDGATAPQRIVEAQGDTVLRARYARPAATLPAAVAPPPPPARVAPRLAIGLPSPRLLRRRLAVRANCGTLACTARLTARLRAGRNVYGLRTVERAVPAGRTARLVVTLDRRALAGARRALHAHRHVRLRLVITGTAASGARTTWRRAVRLR